MPLPPLKILVAMTADRVIGQSGRLPWHLPEDLRLFRDLTWGGAVIMGRRTFASLPGPLPGRDNLVVSSTLAPTPGVLIVPTLAAARAEAATARRVAFVIGGAQLYRQALPLAAELLISWVRGVYQGDVRFPPVFAGDWEVVEQRDFPDFSHIRYRRRLRGGSSLQEPGPELFPPWGLDRP